MNGRPAAFCPESTRWSCRFQIGPAWAKIVSADQPRTCGEYVGRAASSPLGQGSAPHMRGIPGLARRESAKFGISPAHAGNTTTRSEGGFLTGDQPRTCGEYDQVLAEKSSPRGSAPHMRGIRGGRFPDSRAADQPRTCGEYAVVLAELRGMRGSAPHMRGILMVAWAADDGPGISPAHAGNTRSYHRAAEQRGDQPRTCGEY